MYIAPYSEDAGYELLRGAHEMPGHGNLKKGKGKKMLSLPHHNFLAPRRCCVYFTLGNSDIECKCQFRQLALFLLFTVETHKMYMMSHCCCYSVLVSKSLFVTVSVVLPGSNIHHGNGSELGESLTCRRG